MRKMPSFNCAATDCAAFVFVSNSAMSIFDIVHSSGPFFRLFAKQLLICRQRLTHNLTQNRESPFGNSGMGGIRGYPVSERPASNKAEWGQFHSSDKLRTRRPGVRIPRGVPNPRKFIEFPWVCFCFLYFFERFDFAVGG